MINRIDSVVAGLDPKEPERILVSFSDVRDVMAVATGGDPSYRERYTIELDSVFRVHCSKIHLTSLREEITKAIGESPQDSSKIEVIKSMVTDMRAALDVVADTLESADEPAERTV